MDRQEPRKPVTMTLDPAVVRRLKSWCETQAPVVSLGRAADVAIAEFLDRRWAPGDVLASLSDDAARLLYEDGYWDDRKSPKASLELVMKGLASICSIEFTGAGMMAAKEFHNDEDHG